MNTNWLVILFAIGFIHHSHSQVRVVTTPHGVKPTENYGDEVDQKSYKISCDKFIEKMTIIEETYKDCKLAGSQSGDVSIMSEKVNFILKIKKLGENTLVYSYVLRNRTTVPMFFKKDNELFIWKYYEMSLDKNISEMPVLIVAITTREKQLKDQELLNQSKVTYGKDGVVKIEGIDGLCNYYVVKNKLIAKK